MDQQNVENIRRAEKQRGKEKRFIDRNSNHFFQILQKDNKSLEFFQAVVSSLVAKLQLYVQQVNSALEETSQQVLVSMPRIMSDAQVCLFNKSE